MSSRNSHRIKVTIGWDQHDTSIIGNLLNEGILNRIEKAVPNRANSALPSDIIKDVTSTKNDSGSIRHQHVYRFRYKCPYTNHRQVEMCHLFICAVKLLGFKDHMAGELNLTVDVDLQNNRLPWVFDNGDRGNEENLTLALRPGSVQHRVKFPKPIRVHNSNEGFYKLMNLTSGQADRFATEVVIVGHPRTALKLKRFFDQAARGGKLNNNQMIRQRWRTAAPDLIRVLWRHEDGPWQLAERDGPKMRGQFMENFITGIPLEGYPVPDLGLNYELYHPNK